MSDFFKSYDEGDYRLLALETDKDLIEASSRGWTLSRDALLRPKYDHVRDNDERLTQFLGRICAERSSPPPSVEVSDGPNSDPAQASAMPSSVPPPESRRSSNPPGIGDTPSPAQQSMSEDGDEHVSQPGDVESVDQSLHDEMEGYQDGRGSNWYPYIDELLKQGNTSFSHFSGLPNSKRGTKVATVIDDTPPRSPQPRNADGCGHIEDLSDCATDSEPPDDGVVTHQSTKDPDPRSSIQKYAHPLHQSPGPPFEGPRTKWFTIKDTRPPASSWRSNKAGNDAGGGNRLKLRNDSRVQNGGMEMDRRIGHSSKRYPIDRVNWPPPSGQRSRPSEQNKHAAVAATPYPPERPRRDWSVVVYGHKAGVNHANVPLSSEGSLKKGMATDSNANRSDPHSPIKSSQLFPQRKPRRGGNEPPFDIPYRQTPPSAQARTSYYDEVASSSDHGYDSQALDDATESDRDGDGSEPFRRTNVDRRKASVTRPSTGYRKRKRNDVPPATERALPAKRQRLPPIDSDSDDGMRPDQDVDSRRPPAKINVNRRKPSRAEGSREHRGRQCIGSAAAAGTPSTKRRRQPRPSTNAGSDDGMVTDPEGLRWDPSLHPPADDEEWDHIEGTMEKAKKPGRPNRNVLRYVKHFYYELLARGKPRNIFASRIHKGFLVRFPEVEVNEQEVARAMAVIRGPRHKTWKSMPDNPYRERIPRDQV